MRTEFLAGGASRKMTVLVGCSPLRSNVGRCSENVTEAETLVDATGETPVLLMTGGSPVLRTLLP